MTVSTPYAGVRGASRLLTANQWLVILLCAVACMLESMDLYMVAFVLNVIAKPWRLSYGASAFILLASGVGAIFGSLFWGHVADAIGRKKAFVATIFTCSAGSLALAFTPDRNWIYLAALRTVVGFGTGGFFIFVVLVQEFMPTMRRGFASGLVSAAASGGLLIGAISGSFLAPLVGWRGLFVVGAMPALVGLAVLVCMPESPRWALERGLVEQGRRALSWALGPTEDVGAIVRAYASPAPAARLREVFGHLRSLVASALINFGEVAGYYGMVLWAPTLLTQILGLPGPGAAKIVMVFSLAGLTCRWVTGWLADRIGRRRCGAVAAVGAAVCLVLASLFARGIVGERSLFWLPFGLAFALADSSFSVTSLYTSEIWPTRLRGRGAGLSYGAGGVGKVLGPLGLALLIGSSNIISPAATIGSIVPAFGYLAVMFVIAGLTFVFIAQETRGRTLEDMDRR